MTNNYEKNKPILENGFLNTFFISEENLPLSESFLRDSDNLLASYEKNNIDWPLEKSLRERNDILFSFAVSKAENSNLTLAEAQDVYDYLEKNKEQKEYSLIYKKIKKGEKLKQKDHDQLEYFNILKTFQDFNEKGIKIKDLNISFLKDLHKRLTIGLDVFADHLSGFETYNSGFLRSDDKVRVANFIPAPHEEIEKDVKNLISWLQKNPSATNIFIFHASLYAIHPFKNGNKRLCRVLEHFLLQDVLYNQKNLYNISYYYHKHKDSYYKNLLDALYKRNLNYFVSFASQALVFSIASVISGVLQRKKLDFLNNSGLDKNVISIIKPIIKHKEVRFSRFYALSKRKVSRQTFVNYLALATESGVLQKRNIGKGTYYSLSGNYQEETMLNELLQAVREKTNFLPNELVNYIAK